MPDPSYAFLPLAAFVEGSRKLLQLERDAEIEEALASIEGDSSSSSGVTLAKLLVADVHTALFGRRLLTLTDVLGRALPSHSFTVGDIAGIRRGEHLALPSPSSKDTSTAAAAALVRQAYSITGVVTKCSDTAITLALDEKEDSSASTSTSAGGGAETIIPELGDRVTVDKLADDVTFKRLSSLLDKLEKGETNHADRVISLLYGNDRGMWPEFTDPASVSSLLSPSFLSSSRLNPSQVKAIEACLAAEDLCMVHGPPGTGKTTAVVSYIQLEVQTGRKVLACAPSNVAVDNILERLVQKAGSKVKVVRLGHPARMTEAVLSHSLDALVEADERSAIVAEVKKELNGSYRAFMDAARATTAAAGSSSSSDSGHRREGGGHHRRLTRQEKEELRAEQRRLRKEIRKREEDVVLSIIRDADVVLTTNTGAATKLLQKALTIHHGGSETSGSGGGGVSFPPTFRAFDVCVVDEVAQGMEISCLIPALLARKLVIAGDHQQLPPTVISDEAAAKGLVFTLADRFVKLFGDPEAALKRRRDAPGSIPRVSVPAVVWLLDTQYRMHETIMNWSSQRFYEGKLKADESVARHRLADLPHAAASLGGSLGGGSEGAKTAVVTVPAAALKRIQASAKEAAEESIKMQKEEKQQQAERDKGGGGGAGGRGGAADSRRGPGPRGLALDEGTANAIVVQSSIAGSSGSGSSSANLVLEIETLNAPMLLVDTAGCDGFEETSFLPAAATATTAASTKGKGGKANDTEDEEGGKPTASKANVGEADLVVKHVAALLHAGLKEQDVAVVTPYNAQVTLIRALLSSVYPRVVVRSADGWQGQEAEAVVISMVRSNSKKVVGFLRDYRRMNVAVTRAKRHVALICDSDTVSSDPHLKSLVDYANEKAEVRSALEYVPGAGEAAMTTTMGKRVATETAAGGKEAGDASKPTARTITEEDKKASVRKTLRAFLQKVDASLKKAVSSSTDGEKADSDEAFLSSAVGFLGGNSTSVPVGNMDKRGTVAVVSLVRAAGALQPGPIEATLTFPASLSSYERMLVHEACDELALMHHSQEVAAGKEEDGEGEGEADEKDVGREKQKRLLVTYRPKMPLAQATPAPPKISADAAPPTLPSTAPTATSAYQGSNALLRALHEKRVAEAASARKGAKDDETADSFAKAVIAGAEASTTAGASAPKQAKPKAAKAKGATTSTAAGPSTAAAALPEGPKKKKGDGGDDDDDEMALLDALLTRSKSCASKGCKKPTTITGVTCRFCNLRWCYEHGLPEEHGCGEAARAAAKGAWAGAGGSVSLGGTAGVGKKASDEWKREALAKQLAKKIETAETARAPKQGEGSKKKGK